MKFIDFMLEDDIRALEVNRNLLAFQCTYGGQIEYRKSDLIRYIVEDAQDAIEKLIQLDLIDPTVDTYIMSYQ